MERSEKQLQSKYNFSFILELNCSNFRLKDVKSIRVTEITKEVLFKESRTS